VTRRAQGAALLAFASSPNILETETSLGKSLTDLDLINNNGQQHVHRTYYTPGANSPTVFETVEWDRCSQHPINKCQSGNCPGNQSVTRRYDRWLTFTESKVDRTAVGGPLVRYRWDACYHCRLWLCCSCINKCIHGAIPPEPLPANGNCKCKPEHICIKHLERFQHFGYYVSSIHRRLNTVRKSARALTSVAKTITPLQSWGQIPEQ